MYKKLYNTFCTCLPWCTNNVFLVVTFSHLCLRATSTSCCLYGKILDNIFSKFEERSLLFNLYKLKQTAFKLIVYWHDEKFFLPLDSLIDPLWLPFFLLAYPSYLLLLSAWQEIRCLIRPTLNVNDHFLRNNHSHFIVLTNNFFLFSFYLTKHNIHDQI